MSNAPKRKSQTQLPPGARLAQRLLRILDTPETELIALRDIQICFDLHVEDTRRRGVVFLTGEWAWLDQLLRRVGVKTLSDVPKHQRAWLCRQLADRRTGGAWRCPSIWRNG